MALAYPDPELTDGVVRLRPWRLDDVGCVEEAATDPRIPGGTTVPAVVTVDAAEAFVRRQWSRLEEAQGLSFAVADAGTGQARGLAVLLHRPQPGVVGLGSWIVPRARGRGLATRAARLLSAWALAAGGVARVEAWAEPENVASQRVLTAAGFTREGVLRSFLSSGDRRADAVVFSRTAGDP